MKSDYKLYEKLGEQYDSHYFCINGELQNCETHLQ